MKVKKSAIESLADNICSWRSTKCFTDIVLYAIKQRLFLFLSLIHYVTLWVKGFQGKVLAHNGPERICQSPYVTQKALVCIGGIW